MYHYGGRISSTACTGNRKSLNVQLLWSCHLNATSVVHIQSNAPQIPPSPIMDSAQDDLIRCMMRKNDKCSRGFNVLLYPMPVVVFTQVVALVAYSNSNQTKPFLDTFTILYTIRYAFQHSHWSRPRHYLGCRRSPHQLERSWGKMFLFFKFSNLAQ